MEQEHVRKLQETVAEIQSRNSRVEGDKAWETSWFRIITIAVITYVTALLLMMNLGASYPWFNALIPMLGFIFSTLSLPPLKRWWLKQNGKSR